MACYLKGRLLPLANVRLEINGVMPFTYHLLLSVQKSIERVTVVLTWVIGRQQGECSHKYIQLICMKLELFHCIK